MGFLFSKKKTVTHEVRPKPYMVKDGHLTPRLRFPKGNELIRIDEDHERDPISVIVYRSCRLSKIPALFDFLCFEQGKTMAIFQIQPTFDPRIGKLIYIK